VLSLLLDENVSPRVAVQLKHHRATVRVQTMREWRSGFFLGASDEAILQAAFDDSSTLITLDKRTIIPLLKSWGEQEMSHGGVIFVDGETISGSDFGGLVRALLQTWDQYHSENWTNRVVFLKPGFEVPFTPP